VALQEAGRTSPLLPDRDRGLLPHIFTLTLRRLFSVTIYPKSPPTVLSTEPCSILSGLSSPEKTEATERPTGAKLGKRVESQFFLYICPAFKIVLGGAFMAEIIPFSPDRDNACEGKANLVLLHPPAIK